MLEDLRAYVIWIEKVQYVIRFIHPVNEVDLLHHRTPVVKLLHVIIRLPWYLVWTMIMLIPCSSGGGGGGGSTTTTVAWRGIGCFMAILTACLCHHSRAASPLHDSIRMIASSFYDYFWLPLDLAIITISFIKLIFTWVGCIVVWVQLVMVGSLGGLCAVMAVILCVAMEFCLDVVMRTSSRYAYYLVIVKSRLPLLPSLLLSSVGRVWVVVLDMVIAVVDTVIDSCNACMKGAALMCHAIYQFLTTTIHYITLTATTIIQLLAMVVFMVCYNMIASICMVVVLVLVPLLLAAWAIIKVVLIIVPLAVLFLCGGICVFFWACGMGAALWVYVFYRLAVIITTYTITAITATTRILGLLLCVICFGIISSLYLVVAHAIPSLLYGIMMVGALVYGSGVVVVCGGVTILYYMWSLLRLVRDGVAMAVEGCYLLSHNIHDAYYEGVEVVRSIAAEIGCDKYIEACLSPVMADITIIRDEMVSLLSSWCCYFTTATPTPTTTSTTTTSWLCPHWVKSMLNKASAITNAILHHAVPSLSPKGSSTSPLPSATTTTTMADSVLIGMGMDMVDDSSLPRHHRESSATTTTSSLSSSSSPPSSADDDTTMVYGENNNRSSSSGGGGRSITRTIIDLSSSMLPLRSHTSSSSRGKKTSFSFSYE